MNEGRRILSTNDLDFLSNALNIFSESFDNTISGVEYVINSFNNQVIVESFYSSGRFGEEQKEKLEKLLNALKKYRAVILENDGCLVEVTRNYIETTRELVETGTT